MEDDLLEQLREAKKDFAKASSAVGNNRGNSAIFNRFLTKRNEVRSLEIQLQRLRDADKGTVVAQSDISTPQPATAQSTNSLSSIIPLALIGGLIIFG